MTTKSISRVAEAKHFKAWVIFKGDKYIAKVLCITSRSGVRILEVHDPEVGVIFRKRGVGWMAIDALLDRAQIDGHQLSDEKSVPIYYNREKDVFPEEYKAPLGYKLYDFELGKGWSNCYKLGGLKYLKALGYTIVEVWDI